MGAWGIGPFDNDDAAEFAASLDDLKPEEKADAIRTVLAGVATVTDYLARDAGGAAVAAAALVAAQQADGEPVDWVYGPKQEIPRLPRDLPPIALRALSRVLAGQSELTESWHGSPNRDAWFSMIGRLTNVLAVAG
jgi:Domain of unknown function (DUF4259)